MKRAIFFISMILLLSAWVLQSEAQESRRIGLNTTLRSVGEEIKPIQALGVNTIRVPLQWQFIRIRPGEYDWNGVDRLIKGAQTKQIEVLFNIRTTFLKESAQKRDSRRPPTDFQQDALSRKRWKTATQIKSGSVDIEPWLHFMETLANRYRGQGISYEIENEVNEENLWKGTLEEYLEMLKACYDVIKKADPQAKVLPPAMSCGIIRNFQPGVARQEALKWHDKWLQAILSTRKFDVVNIHDYYFPSEIVANGLTFRDYLEHIQGFMKKSGLGDRPIWITETGFVSKPTETSGRMDQGSPEKQAKWLTEAYQQAFEFGVEKVYWLLLNDRKEKEPYFGSMGLADAKGNPRPAWNALKELIKK
jgi:hypothetical protein